MMKMLNLVIWTCLAGVGWAQEAPTPSADARARIAEVDLEAAQIMTAWREEQQRIRLEFLAEHEKAKAEGRPVPAMPMGSMGADYSALLERLVGWADETSGEDAAFYLAHAVRRGTLTRETPGRAAFDRMLREHAWSPSWALLGSQLPMLGRSFDDAEKTAVLDTLAKSPDPDVRGWVAVAVHSQIVDKAELASEEYTKAKAALIFARDAARDPAVKQKLIAPIDLREIYSVDCEPADIEGVDLDGKAFKLSDHRGKVVMLSFWGDW